MLSLLLIIFQHSIFEAYFRNSSSMLPSHTCTRGKAVNMNPGVTDQLTYICSCFGKVLEKVVTGQLNTYLHDNDLHKAKHGFTSERSTLSNKLVTDLHIAQLAASGHAADIISFDFATAFDKSPHHAVIKALVDHGISGTALG